MRTPTVFVAAAVALSWAGVAAQERFPDPVPVRFAAEHYGSPGIAEPILAKDSDGPYYERLPVVNIDFVLKPSQLCVSGAGYGDLGAILFSDRDADFPIAPTASILVGPGVAIAGVFDEKGEFALPIDLHHARKWAGSELFTQGVCLNARALMLTNGLKLEVHPGNAQAGLTYDGPHLTAFMLKNRNTEPARNSVLAEFAVPKGSIDPHGYSVSLFKTEFLPPFLYVYVDLTKEAKPGPSGVASEVFVLPPTSSRMALILVRQREPEKVVPGIPPRDDEFALAAVIHSIY